MKPLQFHPDVYFDVNAAFIWYEEQAIGLGHDFVSELEEAYFSISELPATWPKIGPLNKYVLSRFPFNIIYKNFENSVLILAVAHHSRHPEYWHKRKR